MVPQPTVFDYNLPSGSIANQPVTPRDHSKLMVIDRNSGHIDNLHFFDLVDILTKNDVLVLNQTKVFPARLIGHKTTGGKVEILLLRQINASTWIGLSHPGLKINQTLLFKSDLTAKIIDANKSTGEVTIEFNFLGQEFLKILYDIGQTPTPPYIHNCQPEDIVRHQYQTVYAKESGSAAAPTAGLHFTKNLLHKLKAKGIQIEFITLHVGLGTFQPLKSENLITGKLHHETYEITKATADNLNLAKLSGKRIIAVGTTTARTLETSSVLIPTKGETDLFIYPPYQFKFIDSLITNFHLPQSSLLMLVTAFCYYPNTNFKFTDFKSSIISQAYLSAIKSDYRFFSFGDAMWIK